MEIWAADEPAGLKKRETLWDALKLQEEQFPLVLAIAGSGGKTSLMGQLALEGIQRKKKVAVLTTTHIRKPPHYREVFCRIREGEFITFGKEAGADKITYPGDECYEQICRHADLILVEADGSRGLPVKFPAQHEPVIPNHTDCIIVVCGMSALGMPGNQVCHRWELAGKVLDGEGNIRRAGTISRQEKSAIEGAAVISRQEKAEMEGSDAISRQEKSAIEGAAVISRQDIAVLLESGYKKPLTGENTNRRVLFCMNQADTSGDLSAAEDIIHYLGGHGLALSMKGQPNILYTMDKSRKKKSIAMVYMASGFSRRFGSNKLLEPLNGKPVFRYGLDCLREAAGVMRDWLPVQIIVVSQYEVIRKEAERMGLIAAENPNSSQGISASIRAGIQNAETADAFLFAVADQPLLKPDTILRLVEEFWNSGKGMACLSAKGRRGNPAIFSAKYRELLESLKGDKGGSVLMKEFPEDLWTVETDAMELYDIDNVWDINLYAKKL